MNSHDATVAGYVLLLAAAVALQLVARRTPAVPTLGAVVARGMRSRPGRVALVAGWAWLGLHFFAR